ncbi:dienelactone hydrolase family protein [Duganella sp. S19_KUP01_CR8]|uniref:dienelactone hydrolase family protein n=1 Tax=Duganella sp. S19_KUP01_CR8 TaxID=3025502 RepID=UPI002FCD761D
MNTPALLLSAALLLAASAPHAQQLNAASQGRIEFDSYTPKTMFDLARERRENWAPQKIWGELSLPKPAEPPAPVPAMVLMHGSGGIEASMQTWVDAFHAIGVATFVVSSFEPRGVKRTAEDQTLVPAAANLMDSLQALQLLATHPRIDPARIGVMGFSRGGSVAFQSAVEPLRRAVLKSELRYALHIPVYAGCGQVYWSPELSRAPMLNLVGEADDYTGAAACEQLAAQYAAAGAGIRTIKYAGAHHSWDGNYPVHLLPQATTGIACEVVRWDLANWTLRTEPAGTPIAAARVGEYFAGCVKRGVHVGRNDAALRQSRHDALEFASQVFFGAAAPK